MKKFDIKEFNVFTERNGDVSFHMEADQPLQIKNATGARIVLEARDYGRVPYRGGKGNEILGYFDFGPKEIVIEFSEKYTSISYELKIEEALKSRKNKDLLALIQKCTEELQRRENESVCMINPCAEVEIPNYLGRPNITTPWPTSSSEF